MSDPTAAAVSLLATWKPGSPLPIADAISLCRSVSRDVVPALLQQTPADARPELRAALEALEHTVLDAIEKLRPGQTTVADLVAGLGSADAPTRMSAAQTLAERGPASEEAAGPLLQTALNDADPVVRLQAAVALYRIDGRVKTVLPLLLRALKDPSDAVCWFAADCLRQIGPVAKEAVPAIRAALAGEGRVALVRRSLELAMQSLTR